MTGERQAGGGADGARPKQTIVRRVEAALAKLFRPADTYHPEQYYLRGRPGPKAQARVRDDREK